MNKNQPRLSRANTATRHAREKNSLHVRLIVSWIAFACATWVPAQAQLLDNFATDTGLNSALWATNTPLLTAIGNKQSAGYVNPQLSFSSSGMTMSGVAGLGLFTGVQSQQSFAPLFTAQASVKGTVSNGAAFQLTLITANATQYINIFGDLNPADLSNYGIKLTATDAVTPTSVVLAASPALNVWYTLVIFADPQGNAAVTLKDTASGAVLASLNNIPIGTGPFYMILGQYEPSLTVTGGPNSSVWGFGQIATAFPAMSCPAEPKTGVISWTGVWCDEFAGQAVDRTKWGFFKGPDQKSVTWYCAPTDTTPPCNPATPNVSVDGGGHLVIKAIRVGSGVAPGSNSWTSARLHTGQHASFQYGRIEASVQLTSAAGLFPAFWALGANSLPWPSDGEIDFMEHVNIMGASGVSQGLHGGNSPTDCYCNGNGLVVNYNFPSSTNITTFHTYGAIWSTNMVQFYVDTPSNITYVVTPSDLAAGLPWPHNWAYDIITNMAVGSTSSWGHAWDSSTPSTSPMYIDYIRVYTPSPIKGPTMTGPSSVSLKAGQSASVNLNLNTASGTGRVYLACQTTAPNATCSIASKDALDHFTVDFSNTATGAATASVATSSRTTRGNNYTITVSAYTASNTQGTPDSTISIPFKVN